MAQVIRWAIAFLYGKIYKMGAILQKDAVGTITVYLELQSGGPATGLTASAVTVAIKKEAQSSFSTLALADTDFVEISNGTYEITLQATDTDTAGNLYIKIGGTVVKPALISAYITAVAVVPPETIPTSQGYVGIFGFVKDVQGLPIPNAPLFTKILYSPFLTGEVESFLMSGTSFILDLADDYVVLSGGVASHTTVLDTTSIVTKTDATGYFYLVLQSGAIVDLTIPVANYRRTFTVPPVSINLFQVP